MEEVRDRKTKVQRESDRKIKFDVTILYNFF